MQLNQVLCAALLAVGLAQAASADVTIDPTSALVVNGALGGSAPTGFGASSLAGNGGDEDVDAMDADGEEKPRVHSSKSRSVSVARRTSKSKGAGLRDESEKMRAQKLADKAQRKMNKRAKTGEADRVIITKMPKHLFSGKRGNGKTDRR